MANAIRSNGVSASWQRGQRDAVRIFNDFLKQDEESEGTALTWENLGSDVLCGFEIYERFAFLLVHTYKISANRNAGSFLAEGSALNHLGAVMQLARAKFEVQGSADIKLFFTCVDPSSKSKAAMM